ncbi:MAG: Hsp33 family molecular chaperone [Pseudomonadota bacterium]|nr:Hsp33 family molecular chaperone [Pseudomonadota bacterium]
MERFEETPASPGTGTGDDLVLPFQAERAGASGRLARLGPLVDQILTRHAYPEPVSKLLGEAVVLTALLGASLKFEGTFIFQAVTDGPVDLLVADYRTPGKLRAYARFDAEKVAALGDRQGQGSLLGHGHLAMTIDQGPETERYQGIVPLEGGGLNEAADVYFRQSEQLPTYIRLAVARHYDGATGRQSWRAGGLLLQHLTREGGAISRADEDGWNRARTLAATVEDAELVDPMLAPDRLLYRLFHEEGVRAFRAGQLEAYCRCSEKRVRDLLGSFSGEELADMVERDHIHVTCEFCNRKYSFPAREYLDRKN